MTVYTDVTGSWSSEVTTTRKEFWQALGGSVYISDVTDPAADDVGTFLSPGKGLVLPLGTVLRYKLAGSTAAKLSTIEVD